MMKVIEVGSSEILEKYPNKFMSIRSTFNLELPLDAIYIISIGKLHCRDLEHSYECNLIVPIRETTNLIDSGVTSILLLGSTLGESTYSTDVHYSVAKAGLIKYVENINISRPDIDLRIINLPGVLDTKMAGTPEDLTGYITKSKAIAMIKEVINRMSMYKSQN